MHTTICKKTLKFYSKFYSIIFIILLQFSCKENGKGEYQFTTKVCGKFYVEEYRTFGSGALGGDIIADYLTDSSNFRVFVGEFDNYDSHFSYKCTGDSLSIYSLHKADSDSTFQIVKTSLYLISNLVKQHNIGHTSIDTIR